MKDAVHCILQDALVALQKSQAIPEEVQFDIQVTNTKQKSHGDLATNIALILSKKVGQNPRVLAELICAHIPTGGFVERIEIAGPGFINFHLNSGSQLDLVKTILEQQEQFGRSSEMSSERSHVEFVSANPTGPLHVGHGRSAAYGSALVSVMRAAGQTVHAEYYVNDAGRQMNILAASVWLRYLALNGESLTFPKNGYQGDYVIEIAQSLKGTDLVFPAEEVFANVPADEGQPGGDKEAHIDGIIHNARALLGPEGFAQVHRLGLEAVLHDIQNDLAEFSVVYDEWFSEQQLVDTQAVEVALKRLADHGHTYEKAGAIWFKSTEFGDDKDRVLVRDNGQTTYFASDAAYILNKMSRGFDRLVLVLGADHHGYIPRLKALMQAFGFESDRLVTPIVQFAVLYRGGEQVQMSTRSGSFVTLRELREEVGTDAARFFYLMRKCEQHLDFDLDLAKSKTNENPVYYIQYAHARICSVFRQLSDKGFTYDPSIGLAALDTLTHDSEHALVTQLAKYPETVKKAAERLEPHLVVYCLRDLAQIFHSYYNAQQVLVEDEQIRQARLCLLAAARQVFKNALELLGLSAPEHM